MKQAQPGEVSFWHPVGPHGRESLAEIRDRKLREAEVHGFTLWSFAAARPERVFRWRSELSQREITSCKAVCCGESAKDPSRTDSDVRWATEFSADLRSWQPAPPHLTSYHYRPDRSTAPLASAFVVREIQAPEELRVARPLKWFRAAEGRWENSRVPTRGQYLVETPKDAPGGQRVRILLALADPFVVWVR